MNSPYLTPEHFGALMQSLSYEMMKSRWKDGGKMAYWLFKRLDQPPASKPSAFQKKTILRQGNRNNFAILL